MLSPPDPSTDLHRKLRIALRDGALSVGRLNQSYGIPMRTLLDDCLKRFPEVYEEGQDEGHITIGLRPGAPQLDEVLERRPLLELIQKAGDQGIYAVSLHKHTGITSHRIQKLLHDVPGIEWAWGRNKKLLYRVVKVPGVSPLPIPAVSPSEELDLELERDLLVRLVGDAKRHLHWLGTKMEPSTILLVLSKFPEDFCSEDLGGRNKLVWLAHPAPTPAAADALIPNGLASAPQVSPSTMREMMGPDEVESMRFKPPAAGMGIRRNSPVLYRGEHRERTPLIDL
jgi:hypothetical protein